MKSTIVRLGLLATFIATMAGCSGGGGGGTSSGTAPGNGSPASIAASNVAANNTSGNPGSAFSLVVDAGLAPVEVNSPLVTRFTVIDSSGRYVPGLKLYDPAASAADPCKGVNVKFAIARLNSVEGTPQWQSLITLQRLASTNPLGYLEGATDPVPTSAISNPTVIDATHPQLVGILEENATVGYYTYRFATDVTNASASSTTSSASGKIFTNGNVVAKDNATIHRLGMQLCFVDPQTKATVKVNPYIDFTVSASGVANPVKDSQSKLTDARKVVDRASCNECHQTLAAHGGGRVDPNYCVVCHNPGSTDYQTGNSIDFKLMIHRFHMGKKLSQNFKIQSFVARDLTAGVLTGVDYPQDQRNCVKCHDGASTATHRTKDGNNWMTQASKNACLGCHDDKVLWQTKHDSIFKAAGYPSGTPESHSDSICRDCHVNNPALAVAASHAIPELSNGDRYQYNIHEVKWNADRSVTVEFSVSNPKDASVYNIKDASYQYTTVDVAGTTTTRNFTFGGLTMLFAWGNGDFSNTGAVSGNSWSSRCIVTPVASASCNATTGFPASISGGSLATRGQPVTINAEFDSVLVAGSNNHFKVTSTPLPIATSGMGLVAFQGAISQKKDANSSYAIPVKNAVANFAIGGSGTAVNRRGIVSSDKCNACHGKFINLHGHAGNSTDIEVCVLCHTGNLDATGARLLMHNADSGDFKRMIHMMHKAQGANYPVMPSTLLTTATSAFGGAMAGSYTGVMNCNVCHVNDSYKQNISIMGSSTTISSAISPKASACSACHADTDPANPVMKNHMIQMGGAAFGTVSQANIGTVFEACDGCHLAGTVKPVDSAHQLGQ